MNDFDPSLDEIVSAYVDGVATPDERARVESDPALVERADTFRRLHDALATPPAPVDEEARDALISRALAASAAPSATVYTLRSRRSATLGPIVAAAAVIAMFFGLGTWLVASQDNNEGGDAASTAAPSPNEDLFDAKSQSGAAATTPASAFATGAGAGTAAPQASESAKAVPIYLGAFPDETALRQAVQRARDGSLGTAPTTVAGRATTDSSSCPRTDPPGASIYAADLRGRPVTIVATGTRTDVYDNATCVVTTLG
jgi:hypothetical protein